MIEFPEQCRISYARKRFHPNIKTIKKNRYMKIRYLAVLLALSIAWVLPVKAVTVTDMFDYWVSPNNIHTNLSGSINGGTPFESGRANWTGTLWGRTVQIQGGKQMVAGDIH